MKTPLRGCFPMNKHTPKSRIGLKRLDIRVRDYEKTRADVDNPMAYTCPGSMKK